MKASEVRAMVHDDRVSALSDMRKELMHERGVAAMGGAPPNPGRIRALRRDIARVETVLTEERRLGILPVRRVPTSGGRTPPPKGATRAPAGKTARGPSARSAPKSRAKRGSK